MECLITHWFRYGVTITAWRNLVVNVQVFGATCFSHTILVTTTVPGHHLGTIGIARIGGVSQVVLVML
jgi:hypothetical protein